MSVYKNLMFMSVEMPNGRIDCGVQGISTGPSASPRRKGAPPAPQKDRFRAVRIFDISDVRKQGR